MMKKICSLLMASFALTAAALDLTGNAAYPGISGTWQFNDKPFSLKGLDGIELPAGAVFQLRNGKTILVCKPETENVLAQDGKIVVTQTYAGNIRANHTLFLDRGALRWQLELENGSAQECWLEPSLRLPLKLSGSELYWDGSHEVSASDAPARYSKLDDTFPLTALSSGKYVLALGMSPIISTSYLERGIDRKSRMFFGTRTVLPPGGKNSFEFILMVSRNNAGWRDAVQNYYRVFDENFRAVAGVDPRLGSGRYTEALQLGHYGGGYFNGKRSLMAGAAHAGLEWGFGMYHRQGDFYGRKELWDFPMTAGERKAMERLRERGAGDRSNPETYHKERAGMFENADQRANVLLTFYLISYIEKGLIEKWGMEKYVFPEMDGIPAYRRAWGHTYGLVGHVFPWATPYEKLLRRDLTELVRDYDIRAFGYDCFTDGDSFNVYRGELEYYLPGWSYDSKGKYIRRGLAYRHNADFIHSLKKDGFTVGLFGNTQPNALYGFSPDAYMIEGRLAHHMTEKDNHHVLSRRLFAGRKPLHLHMYTSAFNISDYLNWEGMSPEDIRAAYQDFIRELISFCWKLGTIPSRQIVMSQKAIYRELPVFLEVSSRGWEPVSGVSAAAGLDTARYGTGAGTVTVLSNRTRKPLSARIDFDSNYIGSGTALPVNYRGGEITAEARNGKTSFDTSFELQENKLIQYPVLLDMPGTVKVVSSKSGDAGRLRYEFKITPEQAAEAGFVAATDYDFEILDIVLNGKKITGKTLPLQAGENTLVVNCRSDIFLSELSEYHNFAWSKAAIASDTAFLTTMFTDFIEGRLKTAAAIDSKTPNIIISTNGGKRGINIENGVMHVNGRDAFDAQQTIWTLFRYLEYSDPRFSPVFENNYGGGESMKKMLVKAGLDQVTVEMAPADGKIVPWNSGGKVSTSQPPSPSVDVSKLEKLTIPRLNLETPQDLTTESRIWEKAAAIPPFKLSKTLDKPTQSTDVKIFATEDAIYLRFTCHEANMDQIVMEQTQRDGSVWYDDDFEIRIAPGVPATAATYPYYTLLFNPNGVQADILQAPKTAVIMNEEGMVGTGYGQAARRATGLAWNGDWQVQTRRHAKSWDGIVTIPLKTIQGTGANHGRLCISRYEKPNAEFSTWPPVSFSTVDQPALFAVWEIK